MSVSGDRWGPNLGWSGWRTKPFWWSISLQEAGNMRELLYIGARRQWQDKEIGAANYLAP